MGRGLAHGPSLRGLSQYPGPCAVSPSWFSVGNTCSRIWKIARKEIGRSAGTLDRQRAALAFYVHSRTEESLSTMIALHVPWEFQDACEDWLFDKFLRKQFECSLENAVSFRSINSGDTARSAYIIAGFLDYYVPTSIREFSFEGGRDAATVDVLKIPQRLRRAYLPIGIPQSHQYRKRLTRGSSKSLRPLNCSP